MRTIVSFLLVMFAFTLVDAQTNVSGNISKDSTWTLAGSPYKVITAFTVNTGFTLTVDSGVVVRFQSGTYMYVSGNLYASNAIFTSSKDTAGGTPQKGDWGAIYLNNAAAIVTLDSSDVKFGGGGTPMIYSPGTSTSITLTGCNILSSNNWGINVSLSVAATLINCVVSNSGNSGVYLNAPTMTFTGGTISGSSGLGMQMNGGTTATVTNTGISTSTAGQGLWISSTNSTVSNCTISGSNSHGLQINSGTNSIITHTSVSASNGIGIYDIASTVFIDSCTVTSSTNGQGIYTNSANSTVTNCSITGSNSHGLQINGGTVSLIKHTSVSTSNGIGIYNAAATSFVDSCTVNSSTSHGVQVSGNDSLYFCVIRNSGNDGIYVQSGSLQLVNSVDSISTNQGIYAEQNTTVTITNSSVTGGQWPILCNGQVALVFNSPYNLLGNHYNGIYMQYSGTNANLYLDTVSIPYYFPYDFTVNSGNTMTIASTDVLKFAGGHLFINGILKAVANPGESIYFTSYRDDNLPAALIPTHESDTNGDGIATVPHWADWWGVVFNDPSIDAACVMRRCAVSYAGAGNTGAISMYNASPTIDSCSLANNYYGAMMQYVSNPVFTNNTIGSSQVVPIAMAFTANPQFSNNIFSNSDNTYDALGLLGGTLTANAVLPIRAVLRNNTKSALGALGVDTISNVTYMMLDQVTIPPGMTLTINKGVVIKAYSSTQRFAVQGKLVASTTPDSLIVFTSASDDNFGHPNDTNKNGNATAPGRGDWGGIQFESGSDSTSVLNNCSLHYGALQYYYYYYNGIYLYGGEITTINNANPTISNCTIDQGVYGIYVYGNSRPVITGTTIVNAQYTPIAMSVPADPFFSADTFVNPGYTALGIIGENLGASGTIKQRTVSGFTNITYVLLADLNINSGTNVIVNPGVVIKTGGPGFYVSGGLRAKGTIAQGNIVFTSLKDDNFGNPFDTNRDGNATSPVAGDWSTIRFLSTSLDTFCLIDSCQINYAGNSSWGGVTYTDAGSTISNSTIFKSAAFGIRCENSSTPTVTNVTLNGCSRDPIAMSLQSDPTLTNITFSANGSRGIRILDNTLSSNATLAQRSVAGITNIAYIIDNLTINAGAVFTIAPGVVIKFSTYYNGIGVNGGLVANGTVGQKIIFTSISDDSNGGDTNNDGNGSSPAKGNWAQIDFGASSSDTINSLRNCEFRYGSGYAGGDYGVVRAYNTTFVMDSCVISQSYSSGIGVYGSGHPIISNTQINNVSLTPVTISMFSTPTFTNMTALNVGYMAIGIRPETYSITSTIPVRNFAGYANITYLLYGTITVNTGTTITIPAGVVFKDGYWVVNGALATNGTPGQKVVFTDSRDDSFGNPFDTNQDGSATAPSIAGGQRIAFNDVSIDTASFLQNAVFRYTDGGIWLGQASPKILDCTFERDNWGLYLTGVSNPNVDSCTFSNLTYAPMRISLVSYPKTTNGDVISGTTFKAMGILENEVLVQDVTLTKKTFAGINNIPYLFGNYTVANNSILTINPGLILKFFPNTGMTVRKGLLAVGKAQPDSAIVFTDLRDDFYGNDTNSDSTNSFPTVFQYPQYWYPGWYGITFTNESLAPDCVLQNVIIRYAGLQNSGAAITLNTASPTITYSSLNNNYNAIIANGSSNPTINYCDIAQNSGWGVDNVGQAFTINALNNWWGSNTGPTISTNPGGTGEPVSTLVNYSPFLNSGAINPLAGDVSLNGQVQAYDASLILQWIVDTTANQLTSIQQQVADVSGIGGITAFDASLILQYVVGQVSIFPVDFQQKAAPTMQLYKSATVAAVSLSEGFVDRGKTVTVTLSASGMKNLFGADIALTYNKNQLTPVSVAATGEASGAVTTSSMRDGLIRIELASASGLNNDGALFQITFQAAEDLKGAVKSSVAFSKFLINEMDMKSQTSDGVINIKGKPTSYALNQNYPNPFNPSTTISYQVPEDGQRVRLDVYNLTGQLIRTLVDGNQQAGEYKVVWDGRNEYGQQVSTGLYFFRMKANNFVSVKKMLFVK